MVAVGVGVGVVVGVVVVVGVGVAVGVAVGVGMTRRQDHRRCRKYYKANAETIKAKRRARYRAKVLGRAA